MLTVFASEWLYTFMLCIVVLSTACVKEANTYFGLSIGFTVVAAAYAIGWISGACLNPAVSLGVNMSSYLSDYYFGWFAFYWLAEFLGAATAAMVFYIVRPSEFDGEDQDKAPGDVSIGVKCLCETIGTYFLVLTVGLNVAQGSSNSGAAVSIAAALMAMIYAFGPVSGAHLNPAVTVAVMVRDSSFGAVNFLAYVASQLAGGVLAGLQYYLLSNFKSFDSGIRDGLPFTNWPVRDSWLGVGLAEFVFTFVLAYVVLATATSSKAPKDIFGLCIGFSVVVGAYAVGPISGAYLNPAVSVAVDFTHLVGEAIRGELHDGAWHCLVYSLFQCLAGVAAGLMFMVTHPEEMTHIAVAEEGGTKYA